MSLKEYVAHEVAALDEKELQAVADYVAFLKFRARTSHNDAQLAALYGEFADEDKALAEAGLNEYAQDLANEDAA